MKTEPNLKPWLIDALCILAAGICLYIALQIV